MKSYFRVFLFASTLGMMTACTSIATPAVTPTHVPRGAEIYAVFAGNTPCSGQTSPLPQIPADNDCEQMIWNIVFHQDPQTGTPTTYRLRSAYGLPKPNTNDLIDAGTSIEMEGKWTIATGTTSDPDAVVYQLDPNNPKTTVSFLRVNKNLIHVLSREKTLLVGNGAWSYTLNRMDHQNSAPVDSGTPPEPPTRPAAPPMPEGSSVFGVFDGRTPCHDLVIEFTQVTPYPGCLKIKWRLTLYQDKVSGTPTTYLYMSTSGYREGSWMIVTGIDSDPDAVVYQLELHDTQKPVSFLRVDENHLFLMDREMNLLVGNELFSYTLSRVDPEKP